MIINNNRNSYNKGFSIVEICIVSVIIMVVMIPLFTMMSMGNAGTVHNRNEIIARSYAANVIAYFNLVPYNEVRDLNKDELNTLTLENTKLKINLNDLGNNFEYFKSLDFNAYANVKEFKNKLNDYKVVTVTVEWKESNKKTITKISQSGMVTYK